MALCANSCGLVALLLVIEGLDISVGNSATKTPRLNSIPLATGSCYPSSVPASRKEILTYIQEYLIDININTLRKKIFTCIRMEPAQNYAYQKGIIKNE
jgi:hypothetical protein